MTGRTTTLEIARVIGVEPEEIFRLAFPPSQQEPTPVAARLREAFGVPAEAPQPERTSVIEQEIERMVNRALAKAFGRINQ